MIANIIGLGFISGESIPNGDLFTLEDGNYFSTEDGKYLEIDSPDAPPPSGGSYVSFPETPTFGTTTTISPTDTNIQTGDLGGNTDVILGEGFHVPNIVVNDISGVRIKGVQPDFGALIAESNISATGITRVGDNTATGTHSMRMQGSSFNNVSFYDIWFYGGTGIKGELSSRSFTLRKVKITDGTFAGILAKTDNNNTITPYDIDCEFIWIENMEGEGVYIGQVNGTTFHNIASANFQHIYCNNIGREGFQTNHVVDLYLNKGTFLGLGYDTPSGSAQRNNCQIYDTFGLIENCIFVHNFNDIVNGLYAAFLNCHGITFRNCVFISPDPIYSGNIEARDWWANSHSKADFDLTGGRKILFDNCDFRVTENNYTHLCRVFNDICDHEFVNCRYSNNLTSGLFQDNRIDKVTYSLIDGGGNSAVDPSTIPFPTVDSLGRMLTETYYNRGIGWLTPDPV